LSNINKNFNEKIMLVTILIIWVCQVFGKGGAFPDNNCEESPSLIKTRNGISLFERWVQLADQEKTREISMEFIIKATPEKVLALIKDGSKVKDWNKQVKSWEMLENNESSWKLYLHYSIPWPFNDQDCVLNHYLQKKENGYIIKFYSTEHSLKPAFDSIERMEKVNGSWELRSGGENKTFVRYTVSTKPSDVPSWVTDPFIRKSFIDSMGNFVKIVETRKL
jgi:hypothetical protein